MLWILRRNYGDCWLFLMTNQHHLLRIKRQFLCPAHIPHSSVFSFATPIHSENNPSNVNDNNKKTNQRQHNKITHWIDFPFLYFCEISIQRWHMLFRCSKSTHHTSSTNVGLVFRIRYSLCIFTVHFPPNHFPWMIKYLMRFGCRK